MARGEGRERENEGGREGGCARAWRRLIGQEIKLGLGEMGKWEAAEEGEEPEREGESGSENAHKYAISHAGVDKKDPFIASPPPLLPFPSHTPSSLLPARTITRLLSLLVPAMMTAAEELASCHP